MIKDTKFWREWEDHYLRSQPPDFVRNLRLVEAMYEEARALNAFPGFEPPDRLAHKIRLARALNLSRTPRTNRRGA